MRHSRISTLLYAPGMHFTKRFWKLCSRTHGTCNEERTFDTDHFNIRGGSKIAILRYEQATLVRVTLLFSGNEYFATAETPAHTFTSVVIEGPVPTLPQQWVRPIHRPQKCPHKLLLLVILSFKKKWIQDLTEKISFLRWPLIMTVDVSLDEFQLQLD